MNPDKDGIDHINVYSKGKTELGRWLSNFTYSPFTHPEDGSFNSIEGYWYWLGCKDDKLRKLHGWRAKQVGRELGAPDWLEGDEFKRKIALAIKAKLKTNDAMLLELEMNQLPLAHYYVYGGKVVNVPEADWILGVIKL